MTLGENLRLLRREKGLSQEQVAQTLFVARQTISKWENGQAEPGVESLKALAKLYGVSLDRLVGAESSSVPESHQPDMKRAELADWYWMLVLGFGINAAVWLLFLAAAFSRTGIPLALLALVAGIWRKTPGMWLVTQLLLVLEILWSHSSGAVGPGPVLGKCSMPTCPAPKAYADAVSCCVVR